jgi:hypothetical protein
MITSLFHDDRKVLSAVDQWPAGWAYDQQAGALTLTIAIEQGAGGRVGRGIERP